MKSKLAVTDALFMLPLLYGLDRADSPFELVKDIPAKNALKLSERSEGIRSAFLSPIDYARHGAEYCIMPGICVSSAGRTDTIQLIVNSDRRNIERVAIDVRFTSEIVLASIILKEKFKNQTSHQNLQFIPMMHNIDAMLTKADAALIVHDIPQEYKSDRFFALDLVEEWNDMTDLPYVHGFWVGREEELLKEEADALLEAKKNGVLLKTQVAEGVARQMNLSLTDLSSYIADFSYDFGIKEEKSLSEFIQYAYYYGALGDVPDIRFFDIESDNSNQN